MLVKRNLVARYIETFAVRRSVNYRRFAASSIRYTMYTLVKDTRLMHKSRDVVVTQAPAFRAARA